MALLGAFGSLHRGIYLVIFSLILGPTALVLGITAMRRARRAEAWRPRGAVAAVILGVLSLVLGLSALAVFTVFSQQLSEFSQCRAQAQTQAAQQACLNQFQRSIDTRVEQGGASSGG